METTTFMAEVLPLDGLIAAYDKAIPGERDAEVDALLRLVAGRTVELSLSSGDAFLPGGDYWLPNSCWAWAFGRTSMSRKAAALDALLDAVKGETHRLDHGFEHDALPWLRRVLESLIDTNESLEVPSYATLGRLRAALSQGSTEGL